MVHRERLERNCRKYLYVDFSTAHVYMLELDQWQRANMEAHPDYMGMLKSYSATGPAITALHKGKPVLSFGVVPLWPGVSEAWMLRGEAVDCRAQIGRQIRGLDPAAHFLRRNRLEIREQTPVLPQGSGRDGSPGASCRQRSSGRLLRA